MPPAQVALLIIAALFLGGVIVLAMNGGKTKSTGQQSSSFGESSKSEKAAQKAIAQPARFNVKGEISTPENTKFSDAYLIPPSAELTALHEQLKARSRIAFECASRNEDAKKRQATYDPKIKYLQRYASGDHDAEIKQLYSEAQANIDIQIEALKGLKAAALQISDTYTQVDEVRRMSSGTLTVHVSGQKFEFKDLPYMKCFLFVRGQNYLNEYTIGWLLPIEISGNQSLLLDINNSLPGATQQ